MTVSSEEIDRKVGVRLAQLRRGAGLSRQQLGEALGMSADWLADVEAGVEPPSAGWLYVLSVGFDVSPDVFFQDVPEAPQPAY